MDGIRCRVLVLMYLDRGFRGLGLFLRETMGSVDGGAGVNRAPAFPRLAAAPQWWRAAEPAIKLPQRLGIPVLGCRYNVAHGDVFCFGV